jgi:N-acetylneuraminic acid mutarotase
MSLFPMRPVLPGLVLGSLVLLLGACSEDSVPTQPASSTSAAPAGIPAADYVANSWANKTAMPTARRGLVTASVNGIIYAIGGRSANEVNLPTVEAYNPAGTSLLVWQPKASLPAPRAWPSGAVTINGKIYVPGGLNADGNPTKTLFLYKPGTNTWVKKAAMPVASYGGAAAAIGGKLYLLTPAGNSTLLHRYDPSTNSWTPRASGPQGHHYPVAGVIDGKLYVAGTMNSDESPSALVSAYDPATNTWLAVKTVMPEHQIGAGGVAIGGKLYAVGGFEELNSGPRAALQAYNPATNSWLEKAYLPSPRGFLSAGAANGVLYAIGGLQPPDVVKTNQAYYP